MSLEATKVALRLYRTPATITRVRRAALPEGMRELLAITCGDEAMTVHAARALGRDAADLQSAAGFFVEQVLMASEADDFRILGSTASTPQQEINIRRKLLLRWMHPDVADQHVALGSVDRSVFASRVTAAWERLSRTDRADLDADVKPARAGTKGAKIRPRQRTGMIESLRRYLYGRG